MRDQMKLLSLCLENPISCCNNEVQFGVNGMVMQMERTAALLPLWV